MTAEAARRRPGAGAVLAGVAGVLLAAAYLWTSRRLPGGPGEFAYFPYQLHPLPFDPMRGFTYEQLMLHVERLALLGPALVLLAAPLAAWPGWRAPRPATLRRLALLACGAGLVAATWVATGVLRGRAIVDDELTYRMQAALLLDGRLAEASVPAWRWEPFTIWTRLGATGRYLFGEPLAQAAGLLVGLPAAAHVLLAAVTLACFWLATAPSAGRDAAAWGTLLLALSPMLVLTTATGLAHPTALACVAAAGLGLAWIRDQGPAARGAAGAALLGVALGFGLAVRPQTAVPAAAVLGTLALVHLVRARRFGHLAILVATAGAGAAAVALYDRALTGSALRLPWSLFVPVERFGFGAVWEGADYRHTPWRAFQNLAVSAARFNGWWLGWPASLGLLGVWAAVGRPRRGAGPWLGVGAAIVLFNLFYYSPGVSDTGPVYYYELLLPAALIGGQTVVAAFARWPRWTGALLVLHLGLGTTSFFAEQTARLGRLVGAIHAPAEWALARITPPALLVYEAGRQESPRLGWINSGFPLRWRDDDDPVVTYPRSGPQATAALRRRYAGRACWYFRVEPRTLAPELLPCAAAEALLARPTLLAGPQLFVPSTAIRRGLHPPPPRARGAGVGAGSGGSPAGGAAAGELR